MRVRECHSYAEWFCLSCPLAFKLGIPQSIWRRVQCPLCGGDGHPLIAGDEELATTGMKPAEHVQPTGACSVCVPMSREGFGEGSGEGFPGGSGQRPAGLNRILKEIRAGERRRGSKRGHR